MPQRILLRSPEGGFIAVDGSEFRKYCQHLQRELFESALFGVAPPVRPKRLAEKRVEQMGSLLCCLIQALAINDDGIFWWCVSHIRDLHPLPGLSHNRKAGLRVA